MLDKPDIQEAVLLDCLRENYAIPARHITFLPLGADRNTAVYRAEADDGSAYFVKLRREDFNEMSLVVPKLLHEQGVPHIIGPLVTADEKVWIQTDGFYLSVYPFIAGQDAYEVGLTDAHWIEFGQTLKGVHTAVLPAEIARQVPQEIFSGKWRERVRQFQQQVDERHLMTRFQTH